MEKTAEILALKKAVIWTQNTRDYLVTILALSTLFGARFFENGDAVGMLTESMTVHLDSASLCHLATMIKHGITNIVALCPPQFYPKLIPFLSAFLKAVFEI